ncbi:hypothetical protein AALO_G00230160 [Alosa alosa]|uniref:Uncharacterized protein n=1 Tax=Alosa alosa TaxID=278164 RepID=A0AAV6FY77_9TELE|nr:hypothetical protein AALO_G00230160 [Alosa alosa]
MCHRQQTAAKCYRLVERERTAVEASKALSGLMSLPADVEQPGFSSSSMPASSKRGKKVFSASDKENLRSTCGDVNKSWTDWGTTTNGRFGTDRRRKTTAG